MSEEYYIESGIKDMQKWTDSINEVSKADKATAEILSGENPKNMNATLLGALFSLSARLAKIEETLQSTGVKE